MGAMIEAINKRVSVRTYAHRPLEEDVKEKLRDLLQHQKPGPFGNAVRFALIDLSDQDKNEISHLGTYGVIKGASLYVAGVIGETRGGMVDLGYCLEKVILEITILGLGTCWLGGTFNRAGFARRLGTSRNEAVPAITPVGYPAARRSILDRFFRRMAGSDNRKPWSHLFFEADAKTPLTKEATGPYATAFSCLRLAPSASNRQPWRVVKAADTGPFHFYVERTPGFGQMMRAADLQLVDMGIAMSHFDLAAAETGLAGIWSESDPGIDGAGWEYVMTWSGQ